MQSSTGFDPKRSKNHGSCLQDGEDISEDSILYLIFPVFPIVFFFRFFSRGCYNRFLCMCDD